MLGKRNCDVKRLNGIHANANANADADAVDN